MIPCSKTLSIRGGFKGTSHSAAERHYYLFSRPAIPASKIRTILPMPTLMSILDVILSERLGNAVEVLVPQIPRCFLECAKKHRQVVDCTFACSLALERSLDNSSRCTVAQQDIERYYDHLPAHRVALWIEKFLCLKGRAASYVRFHCCTNLLLHVGSAVVLVVLSLRCLGMYAGSRSAEPRAESLSLTSR